MGSAEIISSEDFRRARQKRAEKNSREARERQLNEKIAERAREDEKWRAQKEEAFNQITPWLNEHGKEFKEFAQEELRKNGYVSIMEEYNGDKNIAKGLNDFIVQFPSFTQRETCNAYRWALLWWLGGKLKIDLTLKQTGFDSFYFKTSGKTS